MKYHKFNSPWQKSQSTACWRARLRKINQLLSRDREGAVSPRTASAASFARACAGLLLVQFWLLVCAERPAKAYVDPGSGALLWQGMLAALFGSAFYFRRVVRVLKDRLSRTKER